MVDQMADAIAKLELIIRGLKDTLNSLRQQLEEIKKDIKDEQTNIDNFQSRLGQAEEDLRLCLKDCPGG